MNFTYEVYASQKDEFKVVWNAINWINHINPASLLPLHQNIGAE